MAVCARSKAADPRRGGAEVNKANQQLALISLTPESASIGSHHARDRLPPSIPTRRDNARVRAGFVLISERMG